MAYQSIYTKRGRCGNDSIKNKLDGLAPAATFRAPSQYEDRLSPGMGIPMLKIRRSVRPSYL